MMRKNPWLWIPAVLFVASCATADQGTADGTDRADDDLGQITQEPSTSVCTGPLHCYAQIRTDGNGAVKPFATSTGLGPADLASAYKLNTALKPTATIAIVDAYNYPNAESDLAVYRTKYGLPACTKSNGCLTIVNQNGAASPLPANAPANDDWTVEAALDLDLASAACPNCKILLVLADDDQGNGLYTANNAAAAHAGVKVISNSWGGSEPSNSASLETFFNHTGISEFVASGDAGYTGTASDYPSTSAYVTSVGGTSLTKSTSNTRGWTEGAWSDGGSSCSLHIAKPSYQTSSACSKRAASDVAAVGDPNTGLAVYNKGSGGWIVVGGTSAASPFVAGVYALYGLSGQGPSYAYSHPANFFDVTTGKNGTCTTALCKAGAGWDGPTGMGTPNGTALAGGGGTTCTPACSGKTCGDDGCGGTCGSCSTGQSCSAAGTCTASTSTCAHDVCNTGTKLKSTCNSCATDICSEDSYCCTTKWDSQCTSEVASICGESCN